MSNAADMLGVTEETFAMIKAATSGIDTTTAIAGIDFIEELMALVPVDTPFFNSVPRGQGRGAVSVFYEALQNINSQQKWTGIARDFAANLAKKQNQYTFSPYAVIGQGSTVTWDAIALAGGLADALAVDTVQTINQALIAHEVNELNSANFALPTIGTVTAVGHSTGGSIGAVTVYVKCAARSGMNWYSGGSGIASAEANTGLLSGSTNSVTASVPAVKGAAGYDWFISTASNGEYYYTTTPVNTVTITSTPGSAQNVPTAYAGLYGSYGLGSPIVGPSVPTTDSSWGGGNGATAQFGAASAGTWINGLMASILGDWPSSPDGPVPGSEGGAALVTPGTGTSQGAYWASLNGNPLTVNGAAFAELDTMLQTLYNVYQITPSRILMPSDVLLNFANAFLDTPQAVMWLRPDAADGRLDGVMGGHVASYVNKIVNGDKIPLWLMPYLPPGRMVAVIDSLPFPGSNVTSALQVRTLYDFFRFDYGANRVAATTDGGPRYDYEVRSEEAFINKASPVCAVIQDIGVGVG